MSRMQNTLRTQEIARHLRALEGPKALPLDAFVRLCNEAQARRRATISVLPADRLDLVMDWLYGAAVHCLKCLTLMAFMFAILAACYNLKF